MKTSPLPCPIYEPQRTSPTVARLMTRPSWREESGASVATTTMTDPRSGSSVTASLPAMRLPMGSPQTARSGMRPKLLCTSTPSVYVAPPISIRREELPIPPLSPKQTVPRPAPTAPWAKSVPAASMASNTSLPPTERARILLIRPSFVSPTTGFMVPGRSRPSRSASRSAWVTSASATRPTQRVLVSAMGVSRQPSSSSCTSPHVFPKPLSTCAAATGLRA